MKSNSVKKIIYLITVIVILVNVILPIFNNRSYAYASLTAEQYQDISSAIVISPNVDDNTILKTVYATIDCNKLKEKYPNLEFSVKGGSVLVNGEVLMSTGSFQVVTQGLGTNIYADYNENSLSTKMEDGIISFTMSVQLDNYNNTDFGTHFPVDTQEYDVVFGTDAGLIRNRINPSTGEIKSPSQEQTPAKFQGNEDMPDRDVAGFLERLISAFIRSTSYGYYALIQLIMGSGASIETLIFNQFNNTKLTLFDDMGDDNTYITEIRVILNKFFSLGRNIAIVAYLIILVYMGIRIMLNAGAQKKAQFKQLFMYWIQGIAILFLFPYVIKYTIVLNNVFVEYVYEAKSKMSFYDQFTQPETGESNGNIVQIQDDMIRTADRFLDEENHDYLSVIYRYAADEGWITYSICWAVIIKEWLTILVAYFKRLITVIFLIAIFPFVSISYAIDKVGDGKSQAFSNWYKEFALNVFLQSFHVIVYVICISLIIGAAEFTHSNPNDNWLLILITLTFLANGEELLKNIFNMKGGGGETVKNTATTLLAAKGAKDLIDNGRKAISKRFGAQSSFGKLRQGIGNSAASAVNAGLIRSRENANAMQAAYDAEQLSSIVPDNAEPSQEAPAQANLFDYRQLAEFALGMDSKENQEAALKMLYDALHSSDEATRNEAAKELTDYFESQGTYGLERSKEFDNKMHAIASAMKVADNVKNADGVLPIELNENIQILLEFHKKGQISAEQIQQITGKSIDQLNQYIGPQLKAHSGAYAGGNTARGGSGLAGTGRANGATRVNASGRRVTGGNRYEGVFKVAPASVQMQRIRGASAAAERLENMTPKERRKARAAMNAQMTTSTSPSEKLPEFRLRFSDFRNPPELEEEVTVEEPITEQNQEELLSPYADMTFDEKVKELIRLKGYIESSKHRSQYTAEECVGFVEDARAIRASVVESAQNSSDVEKLNELNRVDEILEQVGLDRYESILRTQIVRNNQLLDMDSAEGSQIVQDSKDFVQRERIAFKERNELIETESQRRYRLLLEDQARLQKERDALEEEKKKAKKELFNNLKETGKAAVGTAVDMVELPVTLGFDAMMAGAGSGSYMESATSAVFGSNMIDSLHHKAKGMAGSATSYVGAGIGNVAKNLRNKLGNSQSPNHGAPKAPPKGPIHTNGKKDQFEVVSIYDKVKAANRKNKNGKKS